MEPRIFLSFLMLDFSFYFFQVVFLFIHLNPIPYCTVMYIHLLLCTAIWYMYIISLILNFSTEVWKHCTFITLFYRAQIERENKDIRLEKIRVKAAEQRETVLQSIKLVVLSIPFICFLNLPRFFPILILHSLVVFSSPISVFLF